MITIERHGEIVASSKNLRGIHDYARKHPVTRLSIARYHPDQGAHIYVIFSDGAVCRTTFADYQVAVVWAQSKRSWGLRPMQCSDNLWIFKDETRAS